MPDQTPAVVAVEAGPVAPPAPELPEVSPQTARRRLGLQPLAAVAMVSAAPATGVDPTSNRVRPIGRLRSAGRRQALWVLGVLTVVVLLDQLTKGWAWRHLSGAVLNTGSTWFLGHTISSWYRADPSGALLDLASSQILAFSLFLLLRRPRPLPVLLPAALTISGWVSNLGDRLGLHLLTAPGMPRGAVDFAPLGHYVFNIADVCIATGTVLLGTSLCCQHRRRATATAPTATASRPRPWRRARRWALLAAAIPALLGTAATLAATETHPQTTDAPVTHPLTPTSATSPTTHG